jgi:hypothetical protein
MILFHDNQYQVDVYRLKDGQFSSTPLRINVAGFEVSQGVNQIPSAKLDIALTTLEDGRSLLDYKVIQERDKVMITEKETKEVVFTGIISSLTPQITGSSVRLIVQCEHELGFLAQFGLVDVLCSRSVVGAGDYLYKDDLPIEGTVVGHLMKAKKKHKEVVDLGIKKYTRIKIWPLIVDALTYALRYRLLSVNIAEVDAENDPTLKALARSREGAKQAVEEAEKYINRLESILSESTLDLGTYLITDTESDSAMYYQVSSTVARAVVTSSSTGNVWNLLGQLAETFLFNIIPLAESNKLGVVMPRDALRDPDLVLYSKDIFSLTPTQAHLDQKISAVGLTSVPIAPYGGARLPGKYEARPTIYPPNTAKNRVDKPLSGKYLPVTAPSWLTPKVDIHMGTAVAAEQETSKYGELTQSVNYRFAKTLWEWVGIQANSAQMVLQDSHKILPGQVLRINVGFQPDSYHGALGYVMGKRLSVTGESQTTALTLSHFRMQDSPVQKNNSILGLHDYMPYTYSLETVNNPPQVETTTIPDLTESSIGTTAAIKDLSTPTEFEFQSST